MANFIDRQKEQAALEKEYARPGSSLVILYGRRRVGKTTLISEFIKDKKALFYLEVKNRKCKTELLSRKKQPTF